MMDFSIKNNLEELMHQVQRILVGTFSQRECKTIQIKFPFKTTRNKITSRLKTAFASPECFCHYSVFNIPS